MKPYDCLLVDFCGKVFIFSYREEEENSRFIHKSLFQNESAIAKEIHVTASNLFTKNNQHFGFAKTLAESKDEEQKL